MKLVLATPFCGKEKVFTQWLARVKAMDTCGARLLWINTTPSATLSSALKATARDMNASLVVLNQENSKRARLQLITDTFNFIRAQVRPGETLAVLEDDILVEPDSLSRLVSTVASNPQIGVIGACQYWRGQGNLLLAWSSVRTSVFGPNDANQEQIETLKEMTYDDEKVSGIEEIGATATGLVVFGQKFLAKYAFRWKGTSGHDMMAGWDSRRQGYNTLINWGIKVGHLDEDGQKVWKSDMCRPGIVVSGGEVAPVTVALTCHQDYMKYLPDAVASIDAQSPAPNSKMLILDRVTGEVPAFKGWDVYRREDGDPNPGRNMAASLANTRWVCYWDADNRMPYGYLSTMMNEAWMSSPNMGILYPDILECNENMTPLVLRRWDPYTYWGLRKANSIDTGSWWNRESIVRARGWLPAAGLEDYSLALRITDLGFVAKHVEACPPIQYRVHPGQRRENMPANWLAWTGYTWKVLVLLSGRLDIMDRLTHTLARIPFNRDNTGLVLVDNSGSPMFGRDLPFMVGELRSSFNSIEVVTDGKPYKDRNEDYSLPGRQWHIMNLYSKHLMKIDSDMIMCIEEDTFPEDIDEGPVALANAMSPYPVCRSMLGAISAVYECPGMPGYATGATSQLRWEGFLKMEDVQGIRDMGYIPLGFTILRGVAWADVWAPLAYGYDDLGKPWGADGRICSALRSKEWRVALHGGVRCEHLHGR